MPDTLTATFCPAAADRRLSPALALRLATPAQPAPLDDPRPMTPARLAQPTVSLACVRSLHDALAGARHAMAHALPEIHETRTRARIEASLSQVRQAIAEVEAVL